MRNLQIPQDIINKLGVPQIIDITDQLPVNKNYTWSQLAGVRDINDLTTIAWHHDAIKKSYREGKDDLAVAIGIANDHIKLKANEPKGDAGFPYHILIRSGKAYQGNNILDRTYGISENNGHTVHVCVDGNYTSDVLTDTDKRMLEAVTLTLMRVLPNYQSIKAHGELNPTSCPGYDYNTIRNEIIAIDMKFKQESTWNSKKAKVSEFVNEVNYLTSLIKAGENDGNAVWAMSVLGEAIDIFKEKKLL